MNDRVDFVAIAIPLVERGFRVTPVHPETKMGVMRNWQNFQLTTPEMVQEYAEYFPNHLDRGEIASRKTNGQGRT